MLESIGRRKSDGERRMLTQIQLGSRRTKSLCRDMGCAVGRSRHLFALSLLARRPDAAGGRKEGCEALCSTLPRLLRSAPLPIHAFPPLPPPLVPPLQNTYVELGGGGSETVELPAHRDQIGTFLITLREVQSTPIN